MYRNVIQMRNFHSLRPISFSIPRNFLSTSSISSTQHATELSFVPPTPPHASLLLHQHLTRLTEFLSKTKKTVVITGAGVSTESGIPDYRSPNGSYSRGHRPVTFGEFAKNLSTRQRYWARNLIGWKLFAGAVPNPSHKALAQLEAEGLIHHLITQNVDRLHHQAGSSQVIELHGTNHAVKCMNCSVLIDRSIFQTYLEELNPALVHLVASLSSSPVRADGDFDLKEFDFSTFRVPSCPHCGGTVKPAVVMFGENVPKSVVDWAMELVQTSEGLLVIGSSLEVYSAFRFVRAAHEKKIPIGILNIGPTRGDPLASFKIEGRSGEILPLLVDQLNKTKF